MDQCADSFRPGSRQTRDRPREIVDAKAPGSPATAALGPTLGPRCGSPAGGPQRAAQEVLAIQPASLAPWLDGINRTGGRDVPAKPPGRLSERRLRGGQGAGLGLGCGRTWRRPWGVACPPSWRDCAVRSCPDPVVWSVRLSPAGSIARRIRPLRSLCSPCRTVAPCDSNPVARSPTPAARRLDLRSPPCVRSLPCFPSTLRSPAMQRPPPSPAALALGVSTASSWPMPAAWGG